MRRFPKALIEDLAQCARTDLREFAAIWLESTAGHPRDTTPELSRRPGAPSHGHVDAADRCLIRRSSDETPLLSGVCHQTWPSYRTWTPPISGASMRSRTLPGARRCVMANRSRRTHPRGRGPCREPCLRSTDLLSRLAVPCPVRDVRGSDRDEHADDGPDRDGLRPPRLFVLGWGWRGRHC